MKRSSAIACTFAFAFGGYPPGPGEARARQ
jgi:hypothetical protein